MNKILVLYKSKYGAALHYANLMKESIPCDIFEIDQYKFDTLRQYRCIIATGGVYAGHVSCMKSIRKHLSALTGQSLILFAVGASPYDEENLEAIRKQNLKHLPFEVPLFYGRGIYDERIMNFKDRTLCRLLKKSLEKKDPKTFEPWMEALWEAAGKSCDWTDPSYLDPLFKYVENLL